MGTLWSIITNRKDGTNTVWTEWRSWLISVSSGPADAGAIPMLDSNGQIDSSMIPSSATSGVNKVTATIDFQNPEGPEDTTASVTVIGQSWVTPNSIILAGFDGTTSDHQADDAMAEGLSIYVENLVPGVGFDITAYAPSGTWGHYAVYALGVA
jgi:hypothetical protein